MKNQRIIIDDGKEKTCQLFIDDKKLRSIDLFLLANNINNCICDYTLGQIIYGYDFDINLLSKIDYNELIEKKIEEIIEKNSFSKYYKYLPMELKKEIYLERFCDFDGLKKYLSDIELVEIK